MLRRVHGGSGRAYRFVVGLFVFLWLGGTLRPEIPTYGRSGRVSPFRGGQSTYMFHWNVPPGEYLREHWFDQPQMLGSAFGLRPILLEHGFTFAGTYTGAVVGNVAGGQTQGVTYLDDLFLSLIIDLGKLTKLEGWSIGISLRDTAGRFAGDMVGTTPLMDPVSPGNRSFRLGQLSLTWTCLSDTLQISAGRLILNNAFAQIPETALFLNASMSGYPGSIATDITFTGTNSARWGATLHYQPVPWFYFLGGVFSANPNLEVNKFHGLDFSLPPESGAVMVGELGLLTGRYPATLGSAPPPPDNGPSSWFGGKPGSFKIGGIVSTRPFTAYPSGAQAYGNWGLYATAAQMVYCENPDEVTEEGLTLFGAVTYFLPDRSELPWFFSTGFFYQGLVPGRPNDQCGAVFSCGFFSRQARELAESTDTPALTNEMVVEAAYSFAITPWAYITPDIQLLLNPGADGKYPAALEIGFKTGITF